MASIIRIKRSDTSGNPSALGQGEFAYSSLTNNDMNGGDRLYIGLGSETAGNAATHAIIGGKYFTDLLDHTRGNLQPSSALITDASSKIDQLKVDNIDINGNTIITTDTNGDLNITPDGTGFTRIKNLVASNVTNSNLTIGRVTFAGTAGILDDDSNFLWDDSNKQLNITGAAKVDNVKLDDNTISTTNDNGNLILRPLQINADATASQAVVQIDNTRGLVIPVGTTGNRPSIPLQGLIRFNTSISQFEGYNGTSYISIGGVSDVDGNTYIIPELSPGSNENTLFFYTDGVERMTLSASQLNVNTSITTILNATTASTTTTTGAFQVVGGVGIGGQLNVGGATNKFTAATASTTSATGALVVTGGVGIDGNLNVASNANVTGLTTLAQAQVTDLTSSRVTYASANGRLVDSANLTFSGTTLTVTGNAAVTGILNVDNLRLDGNTISTTDGSNTLYLDPAPTNNIGGVVVIKGDLQVDGTTTTINSTQVTIDDPIFVLGGDTPPSANDNLDRGIEFQWHNGTNAKLGFFGFDDSENEFIFIPDATDTASVISGTNGNAALGKLRLTDFTASTTTTSGALVITGGVGISGQLNVGGATNKFTAATASTTTTSGALVITGGVGIGGTMYIGDDIIGSGAGTFASPGSIIDGFQIDGGAY